MKLAFPFIQLPLAFDAERLGAEVRALGESAWRPHPQNFPGNSMLPLIAVDGDPANEGFAGPMQPTPHLERSPYLQQVMGAIGATLGRSRLMRLEGQAEVNRHADMGYYWADRVRVHVPILTQPSVRFECGDATVNMAVGECWIFDTWRLHRVINAQDDQRIHLVVDSVGGDPFWAHVGAGRPNPAPRPMPEWTPRFVPFDPAAKPSLAFESVNVPDVMTPWEIEARLSFLIAEIGRHPDAPAIGQITGKFARDWRALWARHGDEEAGRPAFRARLRAYMDEAQPIASRVPLPNRLVLYNVMTAMIARVAVAAETPQSAAALSDLA